MIVRLVTRPLGLLALVVFASVAALPAHAQTPAPSDEGTIRYRQKLMSGVGADMGAIGDILKYGLPLQNHIAIYATLLSKRSDLVAAAFERDVSAGPTDAKPEIWQDPEAFREKTQAMKDEADKLAAIAAGGDAAAIGPQVKALGEACGSCHDSFRKPKEESYKRAGAGS
jgi:cytochrome c556